MCRLDLRNGKPDFVEAEQAVREALEKYRREQSGRSDPSRPRDDGEHGYGRPGVPHRRANSSTSQHPGVGPEQAGRNGNTGTSSSSDTESIHRAPRSRWRRPASVHSGRGTDPSPAHVGGDTASTVDTVSSSSSDNSHGPLHGLLRRGSQRS